MESSLSNLFNNLSEGIHKIKHKYGLNVNIFLKSMFNTLENYMNLVMIYHFYQKELKLKNSKSLWLI